MYLPNPTADFELVPAGTYIAACYRVIDLGTQHSALFGKTQHKVRLTWELPTELMKDNRPFSISKTYTWSMSKKATLRQHLEAWRGKVFTERDFGPNGFNIRNILGKCCLLTVAHDAKNGEEYSLISTISNLMKGQKGIPPVNTQIYLWLSPELFDKQTFELLHEKTRQMIEKSPEYEAIMTGKPLMREASADDDMNDPIPF